METSRSQQEWKVTGLTGRLENIPIGGCTADDVLALLETYGGPNSKITRTVITTTTAVDEFTVEEFLGGPLEVDRD